MTPEKKNPAASIRARLLNLTKKRGDDFQRVLTRYAIERLLFRLSQTDARDHYVLKGAMLFVTWPEHAFRPTGDLDLLGHGSPEPADVVAVFAGICQIECAEDGIFFDSKSLIAEPVREEESYHGIRLTLNGHLDRAVIAMQVDIGFGDAVYPDAMRQNFPGLLPDLPEADLLMYPKETVVAEKFEAMLRFAQANGRIKDFHDIWITTRTFAFDMPTLVAAMSGTLNRRGTPTPQEIPVALTAEFAADLEKQKLWMGFLRRTPPSVPPPSLDDLIADLRRFFGPVIIALNRPDAPGQRWDSDRADWQ